MRKTIDIIGFAIGWFAVITQFILIIQNRQADISETIIRFFSFFTILTNILVASFFTYKVFRVGKSKNVMFNHKGAPIALTSFILIVGLVYQFVLRSIWEPKGMQLVVDELLHTVIPLYVLIYWFAFTVKGKLKLSEIAVWLLYPIIYLIIVLLRGNFSGYYPYPFLNVQEIGIGKVLLNSLLILLLIVIVFTVLIKINNKRALVSS